jgi:hypothetical protein
MNFKLPPIDGPISYWPLSVNQLSRNRVKDDSFEHCIKLTPNTSMENSFLHLTPPSKCSMRRIPRGTSVLSSVSSSSDTIKDQLKQWSSINLNTSSESEFDVQDLLPETSREHELPFTSKLVKEFKENYDLPNDSPSTQKYLEKIEQENVLRQAHWKYQRTQSKMKAKRRQQPSSPDTATTAPESFSTDDSIQDISAITTDLDHQALLLSLEEETAQDTSKTSMRSSSTRSHLDGLRQLLWPEPHEADVPEVHQMEEEQASIAGASTTTSGTYNFLSHGGCCGNISDLIALTARVGAGGYASKSEEVDAAFMLEASAGSFLYLNHDDEDEAHDTPESAFYSPLLGTSVQDMAKLAIAATCSKPMFGDDDEDSLYDEDSDDEDSCITSNDDSTLQDSVNVFSLDGYRKAHFHDMPRSEISSIATEFYTLDGSEDQTEGGVSEASMATAIRTNAGLNDTMTTIRSTISEDSEPPSLISKPRMQLVAMIDTDEKMILR